jgi:hypothetical protein
MIFKDVSKETHVKIVSSFSFRGTSLLPGSIVLSYQIANLQCIKHNYNSKSIFNVEYRATRDPTKAR